MEGRIKRGQRQDLETDSPKRAQAKSGLRRRRCEGKEEGLPAQLYLDLLLRRGDKEKGAIESAVV